jgi:hypothetical protein
LSILNKRAIALLSLLFAVCVLQAFASSESVSAQPFETIITGAVFLDGAPAREGTRVRIAWVEGAEIEIASTGEGGLPPNEYRIEPTFSSAFNFRPIELSLPDVPQVEPVTVLYYSGTIITASIVGRTTTVTPTPTAGEGEAYISVPQLVYLGLQAAGIDSAGASVMSIGGDLVLTRIGEPIRLPVLVTEGALLESLSDDANGVTVQPQDDGYLVRIALRDAQGDDQIRVLATVDALRYAVGYVEGTVLDMGIDLPTRSRDLTAEDERVGVASVKVLGEVLAFPADSSMKMTIAKSLPDVEFERVRQLAAESNLEIEDLAFGVQFEKQNLDDSLGEITLQMGVGRSWVERYLVESMVGFRIADDGSAQWLRLTPETLSEDSATFSLLSPNGLSGFGLAAVRSVPSPTPIVAATPTRSPIEEATLAPAVTPTPVPPTSTPAPVQTVAPEATGVSTSAALLPVTTQPPTPEPTAAPTGGGCSSTPPGMSVVDLVFPLGLTGGIGLAMGRRRIGFKRFHR